MPSNYSKLALAASISSAVLTSISTPALAAGPGFTDSRAFAMGGVGVAAARPAAASFYNPALLAIQEREKANDFGMLIPSVMVQAFDEDELIDKVDDFEKDFLDPFEDSLNALENPTFTSEAEARAAGQEFVDNSRALQGELIDIDEDGVVADVGVGMSIQIPSKSFAVGFFATGNARLTTQINYEDNALIDGYISQVEAITGNPGLTPAQIIAQLNALDINYNSDDTLDSNVRVVGSAQSQVGLSFASNFEIAGYDVAVGISPKMVNQIAYDYTSRVEDFEFDDADESEVDETEFNFDLGVATHLDGGRRWMAGLSVLNVIPQDITTTPGAGTTVNQALPEAIKIELEPRVIAGLSYSGDSYIVAADIDLTESKAVFNEDDTQFVGLGAEYDLFETVQFRLGARHNLAGSGDPIITTGFGFTVLGASLELAALSSTDSNTMGASVQLGATF